MKVNHLRRLNRIRNKVKYHVNVKNNLLNKHEGCINNWWSTQFMKIPVDERDKYILRYLKSERDVDKDLVPRLAIKKLIEKESMWDWIKNIFTKPRVLTTQ